MTSLPSCREPDCTGTVESDEYCDTCGTKARAAAPEPASDPSQPASTEQPSSTTPTGPSGSVILGSGRANGARRPTSSARRNTQRRRTVADLVKLPPAPAIDPSLAVLADPAVAERARYCSACGDEVGRSHEGTIGLVSGYCPWCGHRFDFVPKLAAGEVVGGQYEVKGCLAYGGLGWIYLARDERVNNRWVVLKGLLNATDEAAMAVAVAEKRFLADIQDENIVDIYNFVPHGGAGYIVMEYVNGPSLKQVLAQRRQANGGRTDPLPVDQAIVHILSVLPAFTYLHTHTLVYCDFKLDNVIHVGSRVKLIDLGAVRRLDDTSGERSWGTRGFEAPEVSELGVSVSSDLYTIGRALAVLTLDFRGYQTTFEHSLPGPADHPALARFDSFHRFLLKATAPHPDDRFESAVEMADQLLGVLQEVIALDRGTDEGTGRPQPATSAVFGPPLNDEALPPLAIEPADPAAPFLTNLSGDSPASVLVEIGKALDSGTVLETVEVRLRIVRALLESGDHQGATALLDQDEAADPWEWRLVWLRGVSALATGSLEIATAAFDRCWSEVPGELAPKLAAGLAAERSGLLATAAALYGVVAAVDPTYIAAASGLARCRMGVGDVDGAMAAYDQIPKTHRAYATAQLEAVRTLIGSGQHVRAGERLERLDVDELRRAQLKVQLFDAALEALLAGTLAPSPSTDLGGRPLDERNLRLGLEEALRGLARVTSDRAERWRIVDRANSVRPVTIL